METTGKGLKIMLRGSWQTINIGDIAHTPGFLSLAEKVLPDAEVWLCPTRIGEGVQEMLVDNFPSLKIADTPEKRQEAFEKCDVLINASGPFFGIDFNTMKEWHERTGKPYGCFGVTVDGPWNDEKMQIASNASFFFCRDSHSEHFMRWQKLECKNVEFATDTAFYIKLNYDRARTEKFLRDNDLEENKFICAIPRLRWTPAKFDDDNFYYTIPEREKVVLRHVEDDMAKLREVICHITRTTPYKVLICPEMTYQVPLGRRFVYDRLPEDVKARCVLKREYWITDEAIGVYSKAHSLVSMDMHSPILFVTCGKPAVVLRHAEDTLKGQMWRDIGLQKWIFELNTTSAKEIIETVDDIIADYPAAVEKAEKAGKFANESGERALKLIAEIALAAKK